MTKEKLDEIYEREEKHPFERLIALMDFAISELYYIQVKSDYKDNIKVNDTVKVYDRFRFAIPLKATVKQFSTSNDGVRVQLIESNSAEYEIGNDDVWVHKKQLEKI